MKNHYQNNPDKNCRHDTNTAYAQVGIFSLIPTDIGNNRQLVRFSQLHMWVGIT